MVFFVGKQNFFRMLIFYMTSPLPWIQFLASQNLQLPSRNLMFMVFPRIIVFVFFEMRCPCEDVHSLGCTHSAGQLRFLVSSLCRFSWCFWTRAIARNANDVDSCNSFGRKPTICWWVRTCRAIKRNENVSFRACQHIRGHETSTVIIRWNPLKSTFCLHFFSSCDCLGVL